MSRKKMNGNPIPKRGENAALKALGNSKGTELLKRVIENLDDEIETGDKVTLNIEQIEKRRDYANLRQEYKDFVHMNEGRVFTALVRPDKLVSLEEDGSGWLFWRGDLTRIEQ